MADRPNPYVQKQPGDIIRSGDWNELQVRAREDLQAHTHKGGPDGTQVPREGIAPQAVDGSRIDPESEVQLRSLTLTGPLTVKGAAAMKALDELNASIRELRDIKADRSGGTFTGVVDMRADLALTDNLLRLRGKGDSNHGLGWYGGSKTFGSAAPDGPVLFGYTGGALGTVTGGQRVALSWNHKGNVAIGLNSPTEGFSLDVSGPVRLGGFTTDEKDEWPRVVWCRDTAKGWDEGLIKHDGAKGFFKRSGFGIHIHQSRDFTIFSTNWNPLLGIEGGSGHVQVRGSLTIGGSDLYFEDPAHKHTGIGNKAGRAAIENAKDYDALMILGRAGTDRGRKVRLWDFLEINGSLLVKSGSQRIAIGEPRAGKYGGDGIRGYANLWLDAENTVYIKSGFQARGLDVAERFPVAEPVVPGQVVVYDPDLGRVRPCRRVNDRRAVGIVSGEAAFILGIEREESPVALCGRVPCMVDADIAPVAPGDLLTTSATPGHACKADPAQSTGAIIGKALTGLDRGRGTVLVLVNLQ